MTVTWHVVEKLLMISRMSKVTIKIKCNPESNTLPSIWFFPGLCLEVDLILMMTTHFCSLRQCWAPVSQIQMAITATVSCFLTSSFSFWLAFKLILHIPYNAIGMISVFFFSKLWKNRIRLQWSTNSERHGQISRQPVWPSAFWW